MQIQMTFNNICSSRTEKKCVKILVIMVNSNMSLLSNKLKKCTSNLAEYNNGGNESHIEMCKFTRFNDYTYSLQKSASSV